MIQQKHFPKMLFLTDSHGIYFKHAIKKNLLQPFQADVCLVHGATISGLMNPNSFTAAAQTYKDFLKDKDKESYIFMQLGEVDCGILMWLKAEKNQTNIQDECHHTIKIYSDFADELKKEGFKNIIITSATIPTISDDDHVGEVISLRRQKVKANYRERTDLTLYFNEKLRETCKLKGIDFIDVTFDFIDSSTGLSHKKFKNKERGDHHMDNDHAAVIWSKHIQDYLLSKNNLSFERSKKIASNDSFVKKLNEISSALQSDMLYSIRKGDEIEADIVGKVKKTLILKNVVVNGKPLDSDFRFIHEPHFM